MCLRAVGRGTRCRWRGDGRRAGRGGAAAERGAALVEFVLVSGLLFLFLFGTVELALVLDAKLVLSQAAREGARRAAIEGGATKAVYERIGRQLDLGGIDPESVEVEIVPWAVSYGHTIRVSLIHSYPLRLPVVRSLVGPEVVLRAEVISRSERVR